MTALVVLALAAPAVRAQDFASGADEAQDKAQADRQRAAEQAHRDRQRASEQAERDHERAERDTARAEERANREDERYERGTEALDEERWDRAIEAFDSVAAAGGRRADAALYWKAYAQRKAGRPADALATLGQLRKTAPQSKYIKEADNLEQEIRQDSGRPPAPERASNDDEKLIALNALLTSNSEQAVPMLEKFLSGNASPKLRNRALFVLTQSDSPRGRAVVADIARGKSHPDMQRTAVKYLGLFGGEQSRQVLSEIYASTEDVEVKKAVLQAYMTSGNKAGVLAAARGEKSPEMRRAAIRQLGPMGATAELWELYRSDPSVEARKDIIQALFVGGAGDRIAELAKTETNPELRRTAVRTLGLLGQDSTGAALVALYQSDRDPGVRKEALRGLFIQGNAHALVQLARAEKDPEMRREIMQQLSLLGGNKEAMDYMMEILNK
ncbi:MAG TPA: HEAT repeat domain-containing protein [Vicinamibacteria bacterium]|nr:HEAT repeat domain-containing protein [Vicinamibacteria bacterium]